jgi:hypothetical protein
MPAETPTQGEPRSEAAKPAAGGDPTAVKVMRNIDVPFLALALLIFLVAGIPILGWVTGAGAWAVQRAISEFTTKKAEKATDPRTKVGLLAGSMIGRGWLVAGIIIAAGLGDKNVGLSAAVLFLATFTLQLTMTMALRS